MWDWKGEFGSLGRNDGEGMGCGGRGLEGRVGALPRLSINKGQWSWDTANCLKRWAYLKIVER